MNITHVIAFMAGGLVSFIAYAVIKVGADAEMYEQRLNGISKTLDEFADEIYLDDFDSYSELRDSYVKKMMQIFV